MRRPEWQWEAEPARWGVCTGAASSPRPGSQASCQPSSCPLREKGQRWAEGMQGPLGGIHRTETPGRDGQLFTLFHPGDIRPAEAGDASISDTVAESPVRPGTFWSALPAQAPSTGLNRPHGDPGEGLGRPRRAGRGRGGKQPHPSAPAIPRLPLLPCPSLCTA